jgi:hypothetical protein
MQHNYFVGFLLHYFISFTVRHGHSHNYLLSTFFLAKRTAANIVKPETKPSSVNIAEWPLKIGPASALVGRGSFLKTIISKG